MATAISEKEPLAEALPAPSPALRLEGITKVYPGTVALEEVGFEVRYGEVHGLIGKNGAGKSTLVGILAGLIAPTTGTIRIEDRSFSRLTRVQAKREGIAIVTQEPEIILDISVAENLYLGDFETRNGVIRWAEMNSRAEALLSRFGLNIGVELRAGDLSLSERQLLLILKACVVENARIVILDESSAPLTQKDNQILRGIVEDLRKAGKAIVYISHHIDELLDICDRLTVLRDGRTITTRDKRDLNCQTLSELIVGEGFSLAPVREDAGAPDFTEEILRTRNLTRWGSFEGIDLCLHKGEILGIAGLRGSGRTEILKALAGIEPADEGEIVLGGKSRIFRSPDEALAAGIAYLPEEREGEGLLKLFSIRDNLTLNSLRRLSSFGIVREAECDREAEALCRTLQVKAFSIEQSVDELSGGNKQKVVIGRIVAANPDVFLLDEPTRGVDVGSKKAILAIAVERLRRHSGIIITSPGLDDLIDICDRILVLCSGKIVSCYTRPDFDEKTIFMNTQGYLNPRETEGDGGCPNI